MVSACKMENSICQSEVIRSQLEEHLRLRVSPTNIDQGSKKVIIFDNGRDGPSCSSKAEWKKGFTS